MRNQRVSFLFGVAVMATAAAGHLSAAPISTINLVTPSPMSFTDSTGMFFSMTTSLPTADFSPFMKLQRNCTEQGYNSSLDSGPNATMDDVHLNGSKQLPMNQVLTSNDQIILGMNYNEPVGEGHLLKLDELEIVVSTDPNKTGPAGPGHGPWSIQSMPMSAGDQILYQMSSATDGSNHHFDIQFDSQRSTINTPQDLYVTLNLANFAGLSAIDDSHHYLYVYSRFSDSDCGYEEWFAYKPNDCNNNGGGGGGVPEPASLSVMALGALGLLGRRRKA